MAKGVNQKIKILYLMKILLERTDDEHGLTLEEITSALGEYGVQVERKTLYDDIETLRVFGMDIQKRRERTVRYCVASREFELPELKLLVDAVQSSKFITLKKSEELIKKIEVFTSRHEAHQLHRQVYIENRNKTVNESIYYSVDHIHEAINRKVKVSFQYFNWNEKKEKVYGHGGERYVISPGALTWDDENYYMIGYDSESDKIKHYRVDKMTGIELTDQKREGEEYFNSFDAATYSKRVFGMYGGSEKDLTLRCKNELAGIIIDRFGFDTPFVNVSDTHFDIHIKVYTSPLFFTWLMNFGSDIEIISPDSARDEFIGIAKRAIEQYENK